MKKLLLMSSFMIFLIAMLPVCFADSISLTYDANGNLVSGDGKFREYNSLNQLVRVRNDSASGIILQEFTHHPTEERILVKKVYNNDTSLRETVYYVSEEFVRVVNISGSYDYTYVKHEGQLVAQEMGGTKYFVHGDHIGSATVVTNQSGDVIENTTYSPSGEVLTGGSTTRFGYEGKEFDSVVGDTDFHFRKYKPEWMLFSQPDTVIQNIFDPQSLNRYMFERANSYKNVDPDGHSPTAPFGEKIQDWVEKFNRIWDDTTDKASEATDEVVEQVPHSQTIKNIAKTNFVGTIKDVGSYMFYKTGNVVFGEVWFSEEELIKRRDKAFLSVTQELVDAGLGYLTGGYYTVANKGYGAYSGNSLFIDALGNSYNDVNDLISLMRSTKSSENVFGSGGGSGYVAGIGYVTEGGKTYPTSNPDWSPTPGVPHYTPPSDD